ncbi:MAG: ribosomal RNA small subunit methyltransferase A, partial [Desulfatitalea sp.]|nr:ribosomal RNA small subunit methyltransferase A [Desulfatitalea sp.]NNK01004.1 ribosomal RNA small subunit methyltransferase A [Desulfatitalea sp.]
VNGLADVRVVEQDILSLDIAALAREAGRPLVVLGNLPYNISSQVLIRLIHCRPFLRRAVLMFQTELADRLHASPGSKAYGRLSVLLQYCADLRVLRDVGPDMFFPRPKVGSTLLGIDFKPMINPQVSDEALMVKVVQAAFGQRRKTLRNALASGLLPLNSTRAQAVLERAGIDPRRRAETLNVNEFVTLTDRIAEAIADADEAVETRADR